MVTALILALAALVAVERILELRLAGRNRRLMLARGAEEYGQGHYRLVVLLHASWFVAWIAEALWRGRSLNPHWGVWLALFVLGDLLRYWCIKTLGIRWNARILVAPGEPLVQSGPYRFLRHPNYVGVVLNLLALPMVFNAWITAVVFTILNLALLLLIRIPAEEQALKAASR